MKRYLLSNYIHWEYRIAEHWYRKMWCIYTKPNQLHRSITLKKTENEKDSLINEANCTRVSPNVTKWLNVSKDSLQSQSQSFIINLWQIEGAGLRLLVPWSKVHIWHDFHKSFLIAMREKLKLGWISHPDSAKLRCSKVP